jgi:ribosomal protein S11
MNTVLKKYFSNIKTNKYKISLFNKNEKTYLKNIFFLNKKKKFNVFIILNKNNVFCVLLDGNFKIKYFVSSGILGFKKKAKKTLFASRATVEGFLKHIKVSHSVVFVDIFLKGFKRFRRPIARSLISSLKFKITILNIFDSTPISFNGCRGKKSRRL